MYAWAMGLGGHEYTTLYFEAVQTRPETSHAVFSLAKIVFGYRMEQLTR